MFSLPLEFISIKDTSAVQHFGTGTFGCYMLFSFIQFLVKALNVFYQNNFTGYQLV